jgi:small subunit ribosomal protein S9
MVKKVEEKEVAKKASPASKKEVTQVVKKSAIKTKAESPEKNHDVEPKVEKIIKKEDKIEVKKVNRQSSRSYKLDGTVYATGRRKAASARVFCKNIDGNLSITINEKPIREYFTDLMYSNQVIAPLEFLNINSGFQFNITISGGGLTGQSGAAKLGIAKCLSLLSDSNKVALRKAGFLTRDSRVVESKKAGLRKARKKEQFSKR